MKSEGESIDVELDSVKTNNQQGKIIKGIVTGLIAGGVVLLVSLYTIWPLPSKISGNWHYKEGDMLLQSEKNKWKLSIANYQGMEGYTLCYRGMWQRSIINTYDGKDVTVEVELNRRMFETELVDELFLENELFDVTSNTKDKLVAVYTKKGINALFGKQNIDSSFHFRLEGIPFSGKLVLYLNNPFLSEERLPFIRK